MKYKMKYKICKKTWKNEIPVYLPIAWTDVGDSADQIVSALNIANNGCYVFLYDEKEVQGSFRDWFYQSVAHDEEKFYLVSSTDIKYEICEKTWENEIPLYSPIAWTDISSYARQIVSALNLVKDERYAFLCEGKES